MKRGPQQEEVVVSEVSERAGKQGIVRVVAAPEELVLAPEPGADREAHEDEPDEPPGGAVARLHLSWWRR